jgi:hypothetical protein
MIWAQVPWSMICISSSFVSFSLDVQTLLKYYLNNLRGCSVGIPFGRDLSKSGFELL